MAASTLHVVFGLSAAACLRDALRLAGRNERVVGLSDCLSFGPIDPPDPALRRDWVEEKLEYTGWEEVVGQAASFWTEAMSLDVRKIAWLSRRSAQDYAGFLEWLWRLGEEPVEIVDLTEVMVARHSAGPRGQHLAISLGLLPPHNILDNQLLGRAEALPAAKRAQYCELWRRLKTENAPLRVLGDGELVSAPLSFFDPLLLACATPQWQSTARIVGIALSDSLETSVLQTGDLVLCARARALADAGRLESRGDLSDLHKSELRLPGGQARRD
jgi:hypothetical protein